MKPRDLRSSPVGPSAVLQELLENRIDALPAVLPVPGLLDLKITASGPGLGGFGKVPFLRTGMALKRGPLTLKSCCYGGTAPSFYKTCGTRKGIFLILEKSARRGPE